MPRQRKREIPIFTDDREKGAPVAWFDMLPVGSYACLESAVLAVLPESMRVQSIAAAAAPSGGSGSHVDEQPRRRSGRKPKRRRVSDSAAPRRGEGSESDDDSAIVASVATGRGGPNAWEVAYRPAAAAGGDARAVSAACAALPWTEFVAEVQEIVLRPLWV